MDNNTTQASYKLPDWSRLPVNRCNVPVGVLGGLGFQLDPVPVVLDGVQALHGDLFDKLDALDHPAERSEQFMDYVTVHFLLNDIFGAGASADTRRKKATYLRLLRGWFFDSDGREAAVMKGWVESRFGLSPCYHQGALQDREGINYARFLQMRTAGIYGTNALEAQLDLLYAYCQYELARQDPVITLYRGIHLVTDFEILEKPSKSEAVILFNNLGSMTSDRETADTFGDVILETRVPREKILCYPGLLANHFKSEKEFLVIGGLYRVGMSYM